jgi:antirestriction protein ArdC
MSSVYEIVTNKIIESLEKGIAPWVNPYTGKQHQNYVTKHEYRGVNALLLNAVALERGYTTPYWITYNQATARGWKIKKGSKAAIVTLWKEAYVENSDVEETTIDENIVEKNRKIVLRYYNVFNLDDVDGVKLTKDEQEYVDFNFATDFSSKITLPSDYCKSENITVKTLPNGISFYAPADDIIALAPVKPDFFLPVFAHECVHSTGHEKRLNRQSLNSINERKVNYSFEELVAEIGSAMLCSYMNINFSIENTASYLAGWARFLKEDKKTAVVRASSQAQKAVEFIIKSTNNYRQDAA